MLDDTGQRFGNYQLTKRLGSGGFADVYLAEHVYLKTLAAVKLLQADWTGGDVQSFQEEAIIIAKLAHPHIVRILDFGIERGIPYLVMEYAPNGTLRQRHPKGTQVPLSLVVTYVKQLASALQYANAQQLIHRDVKPENVLLGQNNELLLSDFGAALITRTSLMLKTQAIIGTVSYMAPEQLRGKPSLASDQYGLGVVVYEWLCGHCPFQGSAAALYNLQLNEPPPSLCAAVPDITLQVEQVVLKALAKSPEQRFIDVQAFADALEQASMYTQASHLFLPGSRGVDNHGLFESTEQSQFPPTIVAPPPISALPETVMVTSPIPTHPLLSRRTVLGSLAGLAVVGSGGIAWLISQEGKRSSSAKTEPTPSPTAKPSPTITPIPTKNDAINTYRGHKDSVFTVAWAPNDQYIASAGGNSDLDPAKRIGDTGVHVWEAMTGTVAYVYPNHTKVVRMVAWSPLDDKRIASASEDHTVHVWESTSGNNLLVYTGHTSEVMAVTWNQDGTRIASGSRDTTVQIWDAAVADKSLLTFREHTTDVNAVAWSPDGKLIASASKDGIVYVWNASTGEVLHPFPHYTEINTIAWSSDSRFIATGDYYDDYRVRIWDVSTGKPGRVFLPTTRNDIYTVAWSPSGKYIAAGDNSSKVNIWSTITGQYKLIYTGHTQPIMSVQWSHSGSYMASGGFDKTVQVWTYADR